MHTRCELFSVFRRVTLASRASYRYLAVAKYDLYVDQLRAWSTPCTRRKGSFSRSIHPLLSLLDPVDPFVARVDYHKTWERFDEWRPHTHDEFQISRRGFLQYNCIEKKKKESFEGDNKFEKYKFCHDLKGLKGRLTQIFSKFSDGRNTSSSSESFFEIDSSSQRISRRRD